jgi:DNA-directed RNA polymerase specialized sigma24 family protein
MTAKEYLSQVRFIDRLVDSKLEQLARLKETATKATMTISDMPRSDSPDLQSMESTIVKMIDMEREINADIDRLVDLKREVRSVIEQIHTPRYRAILEMRYLGMCGWGDIAEALACEPRSVYRAHHRALCAVGSVCCAMGISMDQSQKAT